MNMQWKYAGRSVLVALVVIAIAAGAVIAQQQIAATESGIYEAQPSSGVSGEPDGAVTLPQGAAPGANGTDTGVYDSATADPQQGPPPDENPAPVGALTPQGVSPAAVSTTFSYYQVAGATLRGRSSTTEYLYDGNGCVHLTAGAGSTLILNTEAHIPDNAVIKYIRLYYYDALASGSVSAYLTRYTPGSATVDLKVVSSDTAFSGGFGYAVSTELTETVNNNLYAYTLIGWPSGPNTNLRICGIRLAYFAPLNTVAFLPAISK